MNKETPEKLQDELLYFLNFPLDGIVIDHFYSAPAGFFRHFFSFQ